MGLPFERSQRPLRHGEFYAQWRLEQDVLRAARAGGALAVAVWAALRARAGTRTRLEGPFSPSIGALAEDLSMSERTIHRCVADLVSGGLLAVDRIPGRKPIWIFSSDVVETPQIDVVSPVENWPDSAEKSADFAGAPPQQLHPTPAAPAPHPRSSCTPVPPQESRERRENRSIGDDDGDGFRPLVHRFGELLEQLIAKEPGSPTVDLLEELVLDATDLDAWRNLIELTESAIALSPHLQAADA